MLNSITVQNFYLTLTETKHQGESSEKVG